VYADELIDGLKRRLEFNALKAMLEKKEGL
jgi:hypothetical protein